jgi:pyruvate/2-oxoglutarate dehydrogenase complex dihydrolipoamide dehydrogenase (E3) component
MERMRRIRAEISEVDCSHRFSRYYGAHIFHGHGEFSSPNTIAVNGRTLKFTKAIIATGARPNVPVIPGLDSIKYYTSDNIFNLTEKPNKMLIIGSGPIGSELGQGFARLGTKVTMLERGNQFLSNDDADVVEYLQKQMAKDGVNICFKSTATSIEKGEEEGQVKVTIKTNDTESIETFDLLLIATGRLPNVEGMGCDKAGVQFDRIGIKVNNKL